MVMFGSGGDNGWFPKLVSGDVFRRLVSGDIFRRLVSMVPKAEDVHHLGPPPCSSSGFITMFIDDWFQWFPRLKMVEVGGGGWRWRWVEVGGGGGGSRWPEKMAEVGGGGRRRRSEMAEKIAGEDGR